MLQLSHEWKTPPHEIERWPVTSIYEANEWLKIRAAEIKKANKRGRRR